ncbi:MAG: acyl-CoA dehydrogenase family protein, partial [Thermodesulfobacteriota bacterium]
MAFTIPDSLAREMDRFHTFLDSELKPHVSRWYREETRIPADFFRAMGEGGWFGFAWEGGRLVKHSGLRESLITEAVARISPGVAVTTLVVSDLGLMALYLHGSDHLHQTYGPAAVRGETLLCLGNTENHAGSDVANI